MPMARAPEGSIRELQKMLRSSPTGRPTSDAPAYDYASPTFPDIEGGGDVMEMDVQRYPFGGGRVIDPAAKAAAPPPPPRVGQFYGRG